MHPRAHELISLHIVLEVGVEVVEVVVVEVGKERLRFDIGFLHFQELLSAEEAFALEGSRERRHADLLMGEDLLQAAHLVQGGERRELGRQG